jgi:5-methylcytosine-specific restriction endonuclease McrA
MSKELINKYNRCRRTGKEQMSAEETIALRKVWSEIEKNRKADPVSQLARRRRQLKYRKKHAFKRMCKHANRAQLLKLTPKMLWRIAKNQKLVCPLSGRKLNSENVSLDHIMPLARGGQNIIENIRLTDKSVNLAKHVLSDAEFMQLCKEVVSWNNQ